jgi:hypothetical protein
VLWFDSRESISNVLIEVAASGLRLEEFQPTKPKPPDTGRFWFLPLFLLAHFLFPREFLVMRIMFR